MNALPCIAALLVLVGTSSATAADQTVDVAAPFPDARITVEQLKAYQATVEAQTGVACEDIWAQQRACDNKETRTIWIFTLQGHAAHPAFSRADLITPPLSIGIARFSHYAGDESAFQKWVAEFRVLDERQVQQFKQMLGQ
jgi:hypothetical protein